MDWTNLGAMELGRRMAAGEVTAEALMAATLDRIEAVNAQVNALVSLRDRETLIAEARAADRAARQGWLHGIPVAVKDIRDVAGLPTVQGSPLLTGHVAAADSGFVARMRAAGAIPVGKTNVPEFALGSHTFNPVFGATRNPYRPDLTCGGSSGGAAVALAARMVAVADGTDMMGSLRNPAGWNNVYGFRPTIGRVLPDPAGDTWMHRISTEGPMARNVEDIHALLRTMAAPDPRWPGAPWPELPPTLAPGAKGRRIAWLGDWGGRFPMEEGVLALVEAGLSVLEDLGAVVEPVAPPFDADLLWEAWTTLRAFTLAAELGPYYDDPGGRARLKPAILYEIEKGRALSAMEVEHASKLRSDWLARVVALSQDWDAFVLPTAQVFPFPIDMTYPQEISGRAMDTYHRWMEVMIPVSLAGLPALGVPVGFGSGDRPMGMQIFGRPGGDLTMLEIGQAYHEATDWPGRAAPAL